MHSCTCLWLICIHRKSPSQIWDPVCFIAAGSFCLWLTSSFNSQKWKYLPAFCIPWIKFNNHKRSHFQSDYLIQVASYDLPSFSPLLIDHYLILVFFVSLRDFSESALIQCSYIKYHPACGVSWGTWSAHTAFQSWTHFLSLQGC